MLIHIFLCHFCDTPTGGSIVNSNFASTSIQQLLAAIQTPQAQQTQQMHHHHQQPAHQSYQMDHQQQPSQHRRTTQHHLHHSHLSHLHRRNTSISPQPPPSTKDTNPNPSTSSRRSVSPPATATNSRNSRTHTPKASTPPVQSNIGSAAASSSSSARGLTISAHLANQYHDKLSTTSAPTSATDVSALSGSPRSHHEPAMAQHQPNPSTSSGGSSSALGGLSGDLQSRQFGHSNNGHLSGVHHMAGRMHSPGAGSSSTSANATINSINRYVTTLCL